MTHRGLTFRLPNSKWQLEISEDALSVLNRNVQHGLTSRESVGQLFVRDLGGVDCSRELGDLPGSPSRGVRSRSL